MSDKERTCGECSHLRVICFGLEEDSLSYCNLSNEGVYEFDKACEQFKKKEGEV